MIDLLLKFWPYIAGAIGLAWAAFKLRQSGANAERAKQAIARQKAIDTANKVETEVGALPADKAREELKKWSR